MLMARVRRLLKAALPHAIAAYCVVHVLQSCVAVIPDPKRALNKKNWADARAQTELVNWAERIGTTPKQLGDDVYALMRIGQRGLTVLRLPFGTLRAINNNTQNWAMFPGGTQQSDTLQVRARAASDPNWTVVYGFRDPNARFMAGPLQNARMASVINAASWAGHGGQRQRLCRALASRVWPAFAQFDVVECSYLNATVPAPTDKRPPAPPVRDRPVQLSRTPDPSAAADAPVDGVDAGTADIEGAP